MVSVSQSGEAGEGETKMGISKLDIVAILIGVPGSFLWVVITELFHRDDLFYLHWMLGLIAMGIAFISLCIKLYYINKD